MIEIMHAWEILRSDRIRAHYKYLGFEFDVKNNLPETLDKPIGTAAQRWD